MRRPKGVRYLDTVKLRAIGRNAYRAGLNGSSEASEAAATSSSGELTEVERNLMNIWRNRLPVPNRFQLSLLRRVIEANEMQGWQLAIILRGNHESAIMKFGTRSDRSVHIDHSMQDNPHAGVTSYGDSSILIRYPERLFKFVDFFCMLTEGKYFAEANLPFRTALLRFALAQENFTDGGAYLIDRLAKPPVFMPAGQAAHNFIIAHELAHKLLDEPDTAPRLHAWVQQNSLDDANREIAADALAIELINVEYDGLSWTYPWDAVGATIALSALDVFEHGSHARLPVVEPTIDARLDEMRSKFSAPAESVVDFNHLDYLRHSASYGTGSIDKEIWDTVRRMWKKKHLLAQGDVRRAIELAEFGDVMLAAGFRDPSLDRIRDMPVDAMSGFELLKDRLGDIGHRMTEDIISNSTRFAAGLELSPVAREVLGNLALPVRYYDLIAWILESPIIPRRNGLQNDDAYGIALYLAGTYAGGVSKSAGGGV